MRKKRFSHSFLDFSREYQLFFTKIFTKIFYKSFIDSEKVCPPPVWLKDEMAQYQTTII